jgi:hypothetical protein
VLLDVPEDHVDGQGDVLHQPEHGPHAASDPAHDLLEP